MYATPWPVVSFIVRSVGALHDAREAVVVDPACGTGAFLHAALDLLGESAPGLRLVGFDVLPEPLGLARRTLGQRVDDAALALHLASVLEGEAAAESIPDGVPIVLGNPPYSNYRRMNRGRWIARLMADWRPEGERKWNPDDFMRFLRWAQRLVERRGAGIVAMVTPNTYLDGVTHCRMRRSLATTFDDIHLLDLHGNARKADRSPDGSPDENVFGVQQGIAIGIFVKKADAARPAKVWHAERWGSRESKLDWLAEADVASVRWRTLRPGAERFFFVPRASSTAAEREYERGWRLTDIFGVWGNGLKTDRDRLFIDVDRDALEDRVRRFYSAEGIEPAFRDAYRVRDSSSYRLLARREATTFDPANIQPCLYRPFDVRWVYYAPGLTSRPAWRVMQHMVPGDNVALVASRVVYGSAPWRDILVSRGLSEFGVMAARPGNSAPVFPLYLRDGKRREPNLSPAFLDTIGAVGTPEDAFHYLYAVLHSPSYRERYGSCLKTDFPRVPVTTDAGKLGELARLGRELVALHTLEGHASGPRLRVKKHGQLLAGVPQAVRDFHVGGYAVCRKWLRDRRGRELTREEIATFCRIVGAIGRTLELMAAIDDAIGPLPIR